MSSHDDIRRLLRQASPDNSESLRKLVTAIKRAGHVRVEPPLIALRRMLDMVTDIAGRDLPDGWTLQWGQLLEIRPELMAHHIRWSLREQTLRGFRPKSINLKMSVDDLHPGRVDHWGGVLKARVDDVIAQRRDRESIQDNPDRLINGRIEWPAWVHWFIEGPDDGEALRLDVTTPQIADGSEKSEGVENHPSATD